MQLASFGVDPGREAWNVRDVAGGLAESMSGGSERIELRLYGVPPNGVRFPELVNASGFYFFSYLVVRQGIDHAGSAPVV